jgi:hypothetical protein|tara:strand:+ start:864 stop:1166 length:303 start_codon:yes stop_codon:yes gene_type:complete
MKKCSNNAYQLVEVEWYDIIATAGWEKDDEVTCPLFVSVGYLIKQDDSFVKIATTKDDKNDWYGWHVFPSGCIKKIRPLSGAVIEDTPSIRKAVQIKRKK